MYTMDDLTATETAKLQQGLKDDLNRILAQYPNQTIRSLDQHDLASADAWIQVGTGSQAKYYWIRESNIPASWVAKTDWIDFIVKLAKGPWVKKVGILREFPFTEWPVFPGIGAFIDWKEVYTPSELLRIASQGSGPGAPATHTLTVIVTTSSGKRINGARVDVGDHTQTTNSLGEAYFTLPGGSYTIRIAQTGFQPQTGAITLDQNKTMRYALTPNQPASGGGVPPSGYTLTVHVLDAGTKQPVYGAKVTVGAYSALTNGAGIATLSLPGGSYQVVATKGTYTKTETLTLSADQSTTIYIGPSSGGSGITPTAGFVDRLAGDLHVSKKTAELLLLGGGGLLLLLLLKHKHY